MRDRKDEEVITSVVETKESKKKFYEEKWFWIAMVAIVGLIICRPTAKVIICGNGNGNGNDGSSRN